MRVNGRVPRGGARAAAERLVRTREFIPTQNQRTVITAIHAAVGNVCHTPEDATALLTLALTNFIVATAKPDFLPEAVETVIRCLRINCNVD